ncbi:transmembrane protein 208 [Orussus abietinus]|uniref:transmembrane protein 208 n=1 Tax=Orussus abietinus TaxID=222816 RepID=UPI000625F007|nr:transmembrane protein 208 [Orussus abietinus]
MAPPTKSTKVATRGAKQIAEENLSTLCFYRNMIFGASGLYFTIMTTFFEFTITSILMSILSMAAYIGSYQFMAYMARAKYSESGQLLDSGIDLNMEGGIAEHIKDLIILTAGVQTLSIISNYFWLLWLLVPARGMWMLWNKILGPWFFAPPPEVDEKKQRKMEKKMSRRH